MGGGGMGGTTQTQRLEINLEFPGVPADQRKEFTDDLQKLVNKYSGWWVGYNRRSTWHQNQPPAKYKTISDDFPDEQYMPENDRGGL